MSRRYRDAGMGESLQTLFLHHPLQFPLIVFSLGVISFAVQLMLTQTTGRVLIWTTSISVLMIAFGLLLLPVGIVVSVRRRMNPVTLQCPRCGATGPNANFNVDYPPGVMYAYVTCSRCGGDFTVDRFRPIS